jgi:preprotein translocase subunit SecE
MAKDQGVKLPNTKRPGAQARMAGPAKAAAVVAAPAQPVVKKPRTSPAQFWREVQQEARKISWTSWRETWITSVMVFIMIAITGVFFLAVDQGLGYGMQFLLKLATS